MMWVFFKKQSKIKWFESTTSIKKKRSPNYNLIAMATFYSVHVQMEGWPGNVSKPNILWTFES